MPIDTPAGLRDALLALFPAFRAEWDADDPPDTLHAVMIDFASFLGRTVATAPPDTLRRLGTLIDRAVAVGGPLENAVSTCLLEHLGQIRAWKALRPYLGDEARRRSRA